MPPPGLQVERRDDIDVVVRQFCAARDVAEQLGVLACFPQDAEPGAPQVIFLAARSIAVGEDAVAPIAHVMQILAPPPMSAKPGLT